MGQAPGPIGVYKKCSGCWTQAYHGTAGIGSVSGGARVRDCDVLATVIYERPATSRGG